MIRLSMETVRPALEAAVAERPDYAYRDTHDVCSYTELDPATHDPVPSCLVGQVLYRLGMPLDVLAKHTVEASALMDDLADDEEVSFGLDRELVHDYLLAAQECQDKEGKTWKDALAAAERRVSGD